VAAEIKGVIFDMDGTLTVPVLDFGKLRRILGLSPREDILDAVSKMEEAQKAHAKKLIEEFEAEGRQQFQLQSDIVQLLELIVSCDVKLALVTRNSQESVDFFMGRLEKEIDEASDFLHWPIFSEVLCRDFTPVKPDPAPVVHICGKWNLPTENVIVVGDTPDDMECGRKAGAVTILLKNSVDRVVPESVDVVVNGLKDIISLLSTPFNVQR
jgi:HAD superfamily hydrolase (TIGR01549 family)